MPLLEFPDRRLDGAVEHGRIRPGFVLQVAGCRQPLAQDRHPLVPHARLEGRAVRDPRPPPFGGNAPVARQRRLQLLVDRLLGRQRRQGGTDLARRDRAFHESHGVLPVDQPRRVPVRVERLGVHLPEEEVVGQTDHRIRGQDIRLRRELAAGRTGAQRRDHLGQRPTVIVVGVQPLGVGLLDRPLQLVERLRAPGRLEAARLVESRQDEPGDDRVAADGQRFAGPHQFHPLVNGFGDGRGIRYGGSGRRHAGEKQQPERDSQDRC